MSVQRRILILTVQAWRTGVLRMELLLSMMLVPILVVCRSRQQRLAVMFVFLALVFLMRQQLRRREQARLALCEEASRDV